MKKMLLTLLFPATLFSMYSCQNTNETSKIADTRDLCDSAYSSGIEGPYFYKGAVLAVSFKQDGTIGMTTLEGKSELFVNLPEGSTGNGIDLDPKGRLVIADYTGHNILTIDTATKAISVYAHDSTLNQPNDVCVHNKGYLYCSDPKWANNTGKLWMVDLSGTFVLLEDSMGTTNGICLSPDDKTLYVNESVQRTVWAYSVAENGNLSNKRLLYQFKDFGMDGMKCDKVGNIYIARYDAGVIAVLSPSGKLMKEVKLQGKKPTNIAFGGDQGKDCFVTMQDRGLIETFVNDIAGKGY